MTRYVSKNIKHELYIALMLWCKEENASFNYCLEKAISQLCKWCIDFAKWKVGVEAKLAMARDSEERNRIIAEEYRRVADEFERVVEEYEKLVKETKKRAEKVLGYTP